MCTIDTEGSFLIERIEEMAASLFNHLRRIVNERGEFLQVRWFMWKNELSCQSSCIILSLWLFVLLSFFFPLAFIQMTLDEFESKYSVEQFLKSIHLFRIHNSSEQIAVINSLEGFLQKHSDVRTVASFLFLPLLFFFCRIVSRRRWYEEILIPF